MMSNLMCPSTTIILATTHDGVCYQCSIQDLVVDHYIILYGVLFPGGKEMKDKKEVTEHVQGGMP